MSFPQRYGQTLIGWGTLAAPQIATGLVTSFNVRDAATRQLIDDGGGNYQAAVLHSRKAAIDWAAKVTSGSTNWLDLSTGASITVTGISGGVILATKAVERWVLSQPKTISVNATWFPVMTQASPVAAGVTGTAFTPDQSALTTLSPGGTLIYGTLGMTQASGIIHSMTLTQSLEITEDDVDPTGDILGAAVHGYMKEIELEILAKATQPAVGSTLVLGTGPDGTADFEIESSEKRAVDKRGTMWAIKAFWIPPFGSD